MKSLRRAVLLAVLALLTLQTTAAVAQVPPAAPVITEQPTWTETGYSGDVREAVFDSVMPGTYDLVVTAESAAGTGPPAARVGRGDGRPHRRGRPR